MLTILPVLYSTHQYVLGKVRCLLWCEGLHGDNFTDGTGIDSSDLFEVVLRDLIVADRGLILQQLYNHTLIARWI